jgi:spermidine synthase
MEIPFRMKPQQILGRVSTPDGRELVLYVRDGVFSIRVDGLELMSSRAHGSEEALAGLVLAAVRNRRPKVLVGGLGMGYTLRAVLDIVSESARVTVAEIFPAVVRWNRGELAHLARAPLADLRVSVEEADVASVIAASPSTFDAVLLDVDNGPAAFTTVGNRDLYDHRGLAAIRRCLRPQGVLGVWSADPDPPFARRLAKAGFTVRTETVSARPRAKGPKHTIFVAQKP